MYISLSVDLILKQAGFLWNRTSVVVVKLSSTAVDFFRTERELEKLSLYGFSEVLCACLAPPREV